jgi:shikimate kinase
MNLVLTGFMGVGKSVTGKLLSEELHRAFFDTDALIEKK